MGIFSQLNAQKRELLVPLAARLDLFLLSIMLDIFAEEKQARDWFPASLKTSVLFRQTLCSAKVHQVLPVCLDAPGGPRTHRKRAHPLKLHPCLHISRRGHSFKVRFESGVRIRVWAGGCRRPWVMRSSYFSHPFLTACFPLFVQIVNPSLKLLQYVVLTQARRLVFALLFILT